MRSPKRGIAIGAASAGDATADARGLRVMRSIGLINPSSRYFVVALGLFEIVFGVLAVLFHEPLLRLTIVLVMLAITCLFGILVYKLERAALRISDALVLPVRKEETVDGKAVRYDYDLYVATAMAAIDDAGLKKRTADLEKIVGAICENRGNDDVRIFCAGVKIKQRSAFDDPAIALTGNVKRMRASRYLALFYFENIATSALIEVGMALSLGKESVWFVKEGVELPFLMRAPPGRSPDADLPSV